jgi:hypothetical protein
LEIPHDQDTSRFYEAHRFHWSYCEPSAEVEGRIPLALADSIYSLLATNETLTKHLMAHIQNSRHYFDLSRLSEAAVLNSTIAILSCLIGIMFLAWVFNYDCNEVMMEFQIPGNSQKVHQSPKPVSTGRRSLGDAASGRKHRSLSRRHAANSVDGAPCFKNVRRYSDPQMGYCEVPRGENDMLFPMVDVSF